VAARQPERRTLEEFVALSPRGSIDALPLAW